MKLDSKLANAIQFSAELLLWAVFVSEYVTVHVQDLMWLISQSVNLFSI